MADKLDIKIIKSHRKSIAILVHPDGKVEVRAPKYIPQFVINTFIKSKSDWIEKRLEIVKKHTKQAKKFINGEKFLYLGVEYELQLGPYIKIEPSDKKLFFPLGMAKRGRENLEKWYIKQAKITITKLVEEYSESMDLPYVSISFSDTRSKWGSCSSDNRLQFNWRLIMAPLIVVRYVVIHELVHTVEKNHKTIFWNKVKRVNPSCKQQIKWLKENGRSLSFHS